MLRLHSEEDGNEQDGNPPIALTVNGYPLRFLDSSETFRDSSTMDFLYEHDRKFSDFEDPDMTDMLGPDMFATSSMVSTLMTKPQQPTLPYVRS